jgi:hypothetical protein
VLFAAYLHYRRLGWAPRSGLAHGVDFLLYRPTERHTHAPFSVLVTAAAAAAAAAASVAVSWQMIQRASRNMVSVAKSLVLCEVALPQSPPAPGELPSAWILGAVVRDVTVHRWIPEQDRESEDGDDVREDEERARSFGVNAVPNTTVLVRSHRASNSRVCAWSSRGGLITGKSPNR